MDSVSVKEARQHLARLIASAERGRSTAITRRGRVVAQIAPVAAPPRAAFPDLTAFRDSLGKAPRRPKATIRAMRDQARY